MTPALSTLISRLCNRLARRVESRGDCDGDGDGDGDGAFVLAIAMVKDEQDVIEPFVRHTLRFADALAVLDNASSDATPRILAALAAETGRLVVGRAPRFAYAQAERMTALLHAAQAAFRADFVLPLDADEFLRVADRAALRRILAGIAPGGAALIPWQTFVLGRGDGLALRDPPRSARWRRAREQPAFRKVVLRLDGAPATGLRLEPGNHAASRLDGTPLPLPDLPGLPLIHLPVRSAEQIAAKIVANWLALLAHGGGDAGGIGPHLRRRWERITAGAPLRAEELRALSVTYGQDATIAAADTALVRDRPRWAYGRRYSDGSSEPAIARIARAWEARLTAPMPPATETLDPAFLAALAAAAGLRSRQERSGHS